MGVPGYLFDPEGLRGQIFDEFTPIADEAVIDKPLPNAFAHSSLQEFVQSTVAADACATRPLPGLACGELDAKALHDMELVALADFFACVVKDAAALNV